MLKGFSDQDLAIDYYSERKQKIFKNDCWVGRPPSLQKHVNLNFHKAPSKNQQTAIIDEWKRILPCTVYPQSTPHINNLTLISNQHAYPYSAIGIVVFQSEGISRYCTGSLIYNNLVLTSSVCCYNYQTNMKNTNIYFIVGCWECGGSGLQKVRVINSHYRRAEQHIEGNVLAEMKQKQSSQYGEITHQIAILQLEKGVQLQFGYFGILFKPSPQKEKQSSQEQLQETAKEMNDQKVYISGYNDVNIGQKCIYQTSCSIKQLCMHKQSNVVSHPMYTRYGQTGSPIYVYDEASCKWYIIGIHLGKQQQIQNLERKETNYRHIGLSLTAQKRFQINSWVCMRKGQMNLSYTNGNINNAKNGCNRQIQAKQLGQISKSYLPQLMGLSLNHQKIGELGLEKLSENKWINMSWVQLRDCNLNNNSIKYLFRCEWPKLSRLSITQNQITCKGVKNLVKSDWPRLTVLSLSFNNINNQACQHLKQANWPQLTIVALSNNRLKFGDGLKVFAKLSKNFKSLSWLELYQNQLSSQENIVDSIKQMFTNLYVYV